jgi:lysophospholipase
MELYATEGNPAPPDALLTAVRTKDGLNLRVARWPCPDGKGTITVLPGRAESIEHYFEVIAELRERRFEVVAMDWRGQGLSGRELRNPKKCHIDDFLIYERDLGSFSQQVLQSFCPRPWFALGHSMAAAILLTQSHAGNSPFDKLVLTAPLIDFYRLRFPRAARGIASCLDIMGLGGMSLPRTALELFSQRLEANILTSDPQRYRRAVDIRSRLPQLVLAKPTIGWVNAAFRAIEPFSDPEYPRRITVPILVVAAGADQIVDTRAVEHFASRLKAGRFLTIPYSKHEILLERDHIRAQFWAAFDAFIPGTLAQHKKGAALSLHP